MAAVWACWEFPYDDWVIPQRTCIGCRQRDDQPSMMRVVRVGDEAVEGTSPRLPGRGAYVHRDCLPLAVQRHAFRRAFGSGVGTDTLTRG